MTIPPPLHTPQYAHLLAERSHLHLLDDQRLFDIFVRHVNRCVERASAEGLAMADLSDDNNMPTNADMDTPREVSIALDTPAVASAALRVLGHSGYTLAGSILLWGS